MLKKGNDYVSAFDGIFFQHHIREIFIHDPMPWTQDLLCKLVPYSVTMAYLGKKTTLTSDVD